MHSPRQSTSPKAVPLVKWIWNSYLKTALIPFICVELVFLGVYFITNDWIKGENVEMIQSSANEELIRIAEREAISIRHEAGGIEHAVQMLASQAKHQLVQASALPLEEASRLIYHPEGMYYTYKDRTGGGGAALYYTGHVPVGEQEREKAAKLFQIQDVLRDVKESQPLAASAYINTYDSLNVIYPYFDVIEQYMPHIDVTALNFYYEADEAHNPQRKSVWTEPYYDLAGNGWITSVIAPIDSEERMEGVAGIDITIDTFVDKVLNLSIPWNGYGMLISEEGTMLAFPDAAKSEWKLSRNIYEQNRQSVFVDTLRTQEHGWGSYEIGGKSQLISWSTVPQLNWKLIVVAPEELIYANAAQVEQTMTRVGGWMIAGLLVFYSIFILYLYIQAKRMSRFIANPISHMRQMVGRIGEGEYRQERPQLRIQEMQETADKLGEMGHELGDTKDKWLQASLRAEERESHLQALLSSLDDVIFEIDKHYRYVRIWTKDEGYLVKSKHELIGNTLSSALPGDLATRYMDIVNETLTTNRTQTLEYALQTMKEEWRWFSARVSPILKQTNEENTVLILVRDITERKQMEQRLIEAKNAAELASQAKSEFLSRVSHELRTPLNAILGFAQVMQFDPEEPLSEVQMDNVDEIMRAGKHLLELINEVLDITRIESGKMSLSMETVAVDELLNECMDLLEPMAQDYGIALKKEQTAACHLVIHADYTRLKQVLINLMSNAVKYNRNAGSVLVGCELVHQEVRISVTDTGPGIPEDQMQLIFEPFTRIEDQTVGIEGSGIGLTLARQLTELMGGRIEVESKVGEGSRFSVYLPHNLKPIESDPDVEAAISNSETKYQVLYIDDNPANLLLMDKVAVHLPEVEWKNVKSGREGIQLAGQQCPDLILLDIHMPEMDGFETLEVLRSLQRCCDIPVIAVSASISSLDHKKAMELGFDDYIPKPIELSSFVHKIKTYLHA
ncbi:ATP-binding protein [Marinicrinis sediminis]|uniref:histidine kinase n=1 Tax=Marinicrinis sediminis TaxID=1652465 RepID=A0ABW5RD83_9BACL